MFRQALGLSLDLISVSPYHMNDIGVPYILMSKAAGRPFSLSEDGPVEGMRAFSTLTPQGKERIMYQLGYFARQLYEHRFPLIGSLVENGDQVEVRECLSPGHLWSNRDKIEGIRRGPFRNESEYYSSLSAALRLQAEQLEMGNSILRAPAPQHQEYPDEARWLSAQNRWSDSASLEGMADSKANRMQYCLASQLLDEVVIPRIVDPFGGSGYCLYNHNLALHDIYVDGDFKITCITDWAFSSTVPPAQVFVPPGLPNPGVPADDYLVSAFRCGFDFISARIGGRTIGQWGSQKFKEWEMMWHFHRLVNQDTDQDSDHLDALCGLALLGFNDGGKISAALLANRMWASDPINRAREPASDTRQWSRNTSIDAAFTERR